MEKDKWSGPHPKTIQNFAGGTTWCRQRSPRLLETQMVSSYVHGLAATCSRPWALETVCKFLKELCVGCSQCGYTTEIHQMLRGHCEPIMLVVHSLLMAGGGGVDWLRLASNGGRGPE